MAKSNSPSGKVEERIEGLTLRLGISAKEYKEVAKPLERDLARRLCLHLPARARALAG